MLIAMASARGQGMRQPQWWGLLEKFRRLYPSARRRHPVRAAPFATYLDEIFSA